MIVLFVSQCQKKARKRTRRVLDSYASRIGSATWKTRITEEGLKTVKKVLAKQASRNTAVACHVIAGHKLTRLVWIVGNRSKFDRYGNIPTHTTRSAVDFSAENEWPVMEDIKVSLALAALFHDFGKAWDLFQEMLFGAQGRDWLRHEFLSLAVFAAFVAGRPDHEWLNELAAGSANWEDILERLPDYLEKPFQGLNSAFSRTVGWLIASHHLLGHPGEEQWADLESAVLAEISPSTDYIKDAGNEDAPQFSSGLPITANWCRQARKWALRAQNRMEMFPADEGGAGSLRFVRHVARTALMLGDHAYSSLVGARWNDGFLAAKSSKGDETPQYLDEHLVGVMRSALDAVHYLPFLQTGLDKAPDVQGLRGRSTDPRFNWQDEAADTIHEAVERAGLGQTGVLALNMASTGTGKTFANAKLVRAIQQGDLRYTLALGLRSLTLQTGDEYRERIGMDDTELAVIIGSIAFRELHEAQKQQEEDVSFDDSGWQDISFERPVQDKKLQTVLKRPNARRILYSPVLACTIDHVIGATENTKKGRHILPFLRMLSSDLVIDEVDDFAGKDMHAVLRLVHLAGMLGRNVVVSSATIPPEEAMALYDAYQGGRSVFAAATGRPESVLCAWVDELSGATTKIPEKRKGFERGHYSFVGKRAKKLRKYPPKRKAEVVDASDPARYAQTVLDTCVTMHGRHAESYEGKNVSFGVLRLANTSQCVAMALYLLSTENIPENHVIRVLPYHSRYPMLVRHEIESTLDGILKRKDPEAPYRNESVQKALARTDADNVLFIAVTTPIEELGRDHDFDWGVVEPSSIRSIIQLAGRVLRHRDIHPEKPNIAILSHNVRALRGSKICFTRPGFETSGLQLNTKDMSEIVDTELLGHRVDSAMRIQGGNGDPETDLLSLEHEQLRRQLLTGEKQEPDNLPAWIGGPWHLFAKTQEMTAFRSGSPEEEMLYLPNSSGNKFCFYRQPDRHEDGPVKHDSFVGDVELPDTAKKRLWIDPDPGKLTEDIAEKTDTPPEKTPRRFGKINMPRQWVNDPKYHGRIKFHPALGVFEMKPYKDFDFFHYLHI